MQLLEDLKNLQARSTFGAFESRFKDQAAAAKTDVEKLRQAIAGHTSSSTLQIVTSHYQKQVSEAAEKLKSLGEWRDGKWFAKTGVSKSTFDDALKVYGEVNTEFTDFLTGAKKYALNFNGQTIEVEVSKELKNAFTDAQRSVGEAKGIMDGMFGRLRVNGISGEGIKATAKHNFDRTKFWTKEFWKEGTHGTRGVAFARVGGVAAGAAMTVDALLRGKDSAGEDRSWVVRVGEGAAGLGLGAAAVLAGKAR